MNKFLITLARIPKCQPRFGFADILKDKDKGDETVYFTKEDQKLMSKLLKKMKENNDKQKSSSSNEKEDKEDLQKILSRYKINYTDALIDEVLNWKKGD
ncbi:unnamed protein product [Paramecium pentaurelia]|uniref:Uncharacterized protein n=1 Tax=Paramecium pentaurelia TaxID=43138 RepID=A0A8S1YCI4_9CILI|nr:unnamed protein product [Paramecium pentaurelia]